jgi:hypothetical protein
MRDALARFRCDREQPFGHLGAVAVVRHEAVIGRIGVPVIVGEAVEQRAEGADCGKVPGV